MADNFSIKVSICCVTYNHEKFIAQSLDGFIKQQTSFEYEILVHDDASTDETQKIVKEFELKYPKLFRCFYQSENQFKKQNTLVNILFKAARGQYIALCEGDDYWTDPYKLQKQVDFMEVNPSFTFCFSNILNVDQDSKELDISWPNKNESFTLTKKMIGEEYLVSTPTILFKNNIANLDYINEMRNSPLGDYLIISILLLKGKGYYFPEKMAAYRHHNEGIFSNIDLQSKIELGLKTRKILLGYLLKIGELASFLILYKNYLKFKKRYNM